MTKLIPASAGLLLIWLLTGCAPTADELWAGRFTKDQKMQVSMTRADKWIQDGKRIPDPDLLSQARRELTFLAETFQYQPAKDKLAELELYLKEFAGQKEKLARAAAEKKNLFTAATHFKALLALIPDHAEAKAFMTQNEAEIQKRLLKNLSDGQTALKGKDFATARRCYNRVLSYDPANPEAAEGLKAVKKAEKAASKPEDKETAYKKGLDAYEKKDFLKAYEFFNSIEDSSYKDTTLYMQRVQDKIETLGLDGKDN